jgi:hypothetical protein
MMATPIKAYDAVGGPPVDHVKDMRPDPADPTGKRQLWTGHYIDRTKAGKYTLHFEGQHVSSRWPLSKIPFGANLKINPKDPTDVLWRAKHSSWRSTRKTLGLNPLVHMPRAITEESDSLTAKVGGLPSHTMPTHWPFNDFGHAVWYMVDETTGIQSQQFVHETPENERQRELKLPVILDYSHGCIHVNPSDIDDMMKKHYLVSRTRFVVHRYGEVAPPSSAFGHGVRRHGKYVLHFFPGSKKIVVFRY